MAVPRLVLFDIDGTLLWPDGSGRASMKAGLIELFGTPGAIDNYTFSGHTDRETIFTLMRDEGFSDADIEERFGQLGPVMARELGRLVDAQRHNIRPCPGASDLVGHLHDHDDVMLGLVTGNLEPVAALKLRTAGYDPDIFRVAAYGHLSPLRADLPPHAVEQARQRTGVEFKKGQVVIIGDTPADVTCGLGVGARSIAVATGFSKPEELQAAGPDYLFADLSQMDDVLAAIFSSVAAD